MQDLTVAVAHLPFAGRVPWKWNKDSAPRVLSGRKGCQVLYSQLRWLMLPSGGETPPETSEVFVAELSESDLP